MKILKAATLMVFMISVILGMAWIVWFNETIRYLILGVVSLEIIWLLWNLCLELVDSEQLER
jgi:hypothetical protein